MAYMAYMLTKIRHTTIKLKKNNKDKENVNARPKLKIMSTNSILGVFNK